MPPPVFDALVEINLTDFCASLGIKRRPIHDLLFRWPARRFARQVLEFDRRVGAHGLRAASQWICAHMIGPIDVRGATPVPAHGPVLIVSNHPGLSDTVNLFASIARDDLRVVASRRPFLLALENTSAYMVYVEEDAGKRMSAFRSVVGELKAGRAALTFPAGKIEPDPAVRKADAVTSLKTWGESIGLLVRLLPNLAVVPAIVSGIYWPSIYDHPLVRRRADWTERDRLAAALQIIAAGIRRKTVNLAFGPALPARELAQLGDAATITRAIAQAAQRLM